MAGGLGERLAIDPVIARAAFVLLALGAGAGLVLYLVLWVAMPEDDGSAVALPPSNRKGLASGLVVLGVLLLLRDAGLWLGDAAAWSLGLATVGVAIIWIRSDSHERARWNRMAERVADSPIEIVLGGRAAPARLVIGLALAAAGAATFLARTDALVSAANIVIAVVVTIAGLALLFGPAIYRLVRQLGEERRERIRSQERSEMAAHLHDSVLQTLALIQRSEGAREMVALARSQERELRAWLSDGARRDEVSLAAGIENMVAAVELQFKVPMEVVTVGDVLLDDRVQALVDATREATVNAAKHSGADRVSVYVEVEPSSVSAFVRDQGSGFDADGIADDRRGIRDSIMARMHRVAGSATISTEPGEGTEVQLTLPRDTQ